MHTGDGDIVEHDVRAADQMEEVRRLEGKPGDSAALDHLRAPLRRVRTGGAAPSGARVDVRIHPHAPPPAAAGMNRAAASDLDVAQVVAADERLLGRRRRAAEVVRRWVGVPGDHWP